MKIEMQDDTLNVSDLEELAAANVEAFRKGVHAVLTNEVKAVEIDLSRTGFVDSCGLGALIGVYKAINFRNGRVPIRLLNPTPPVQQMFELTRTHRLFEIVRR